MSTNRKKCCAPGCEVEIDRTYLMCGDHWAQVSDVDRREVYKRLKHWQNGTGHAREYLAARSRAIASIKGGAA